MASTVHRLHLNATAPRSATLGGSADADELTSKLVDYLQDVHALEQGVARQLDGWLEHASGDLRRLLAGHLLETRRHARLIHQRLQAYGVSASIRKEIEGKVITIAKGIADGVRTDQPGKILRDAYVSEHLEIAAYQLLERLAVRVGDVLTAEVAHDIRLEEEAFVTQLDCIWGLAVDDTFDIQHMNAS